MITLYQFQSCPFCSKVRALLHYIDQPFEVVEVSPFGKKELSFTDYKKVPVLKDDEKVVTGSATIIEYVNTHFAKFSVDEKASKWTDWIDNTLVHYLPPLIHPSFFASYKNFSQILKAGQFNWFKTRIFRLGGAIVMPKVARKMQAKYKINDAEAEYLDAIHHWVDKGLNGQNFFGGDAPDFVDCSVFGVLNSCHELGPIALASKSNDKFASWYSECEHLMVKRLLL